MSGQTAPLLLLLLSLILLLGYQLDSTWQTHFNPIFAALILGLVAAFLLSLLSTGRRWLASLAKPAAKQTLALWQQQALRLGIVLFALNIAPSALLGIEPWQLLKLVMLVALVFTLALWLGRRWFKLPPELVLLVSAGISFCGTSAIFATHSLRLSANHDDSAQAYLTQSLAAVLLVGLLALGIYSLLLQQPWLGSAELAWLIGSTAPEVAQAVAAGSQLAEHAPQAIIAKLSRVCLLLPFLCGLSLLLRTQQRKRQCKQQPGQAPQNAVVFPWFILLFIGLLLSQLLVTIPSWLQHFASLLSQGCLIFAMLATGLQTRAQDLRQCSVRLFGFATLVLVLLFGLALALLQL
ncbi:putative sulfate exporter family transporter [Rheinheimera riviphila]|nr:putative sulfate exporter family transporter [Rheinheimera riviphila]